MNVLIAIVVTFLVSTVAVVGYLYSTGSTLIWTPKKKV